MNNLQEEHDAKEVGRVRKVHVTVQYTSTAAEKKFVIESSATLEKVVKEAYDKLGESPRPGDQLFCHKEPRHELAPYLASTLDEMHKKGVCVTESGRAKLEFEFDIDSDIGGAAA